MTMAAKKIETADVRWYVVHTNAGKERLASEALKAAGYRVFYPWYFARVSHARQQYNVMRPYFPRYLFIGVAEGQSFWDANHAIGVSTVVHGLLRTDSDGRREYGPMELSGTGVGAMMARCDELGQVLDGPKKPTPRHRETPGFKAGTPVIVTDGPLKGGEGVVYFDDGVDETVTIEMAMLGKENIMVVRADCLAAVRRLANIGP